MDKKCIDLVVCGPDMSGTGTQINDIINFFCYINKKVRDIRGTEIEALFHAEIFSNFNSKYTNFKEFLNDKNVTLNKKMELNFDITKLLIGEWDSRQFDNTNKDLKIASFLKNDVSTYINPDSADVWIMEEPTKRGAGQVNRTIEQHRTKYESSFDPIAATYAHQTYRIDEFLRFRKVLREKNKIIIRSRSEESACYQIYDKDKLPEGIKMKDYLNLPGIKTAFANPPTHLFVVCAPSTWTTKEYIKMKKERGKGRTNDDYEKNAEYQVLVNFRYATNWLYNLYKEGCRLNKSEIPKIIKMSIYDSKERIKSNMVNELKNIIANNK